MHPATDPTDSAIDTGCSAVEKRVTVYPEHSLFSLLVVALLAAGALYAVNWSLREEVTHVHRWNFATLAEGEGPWSFPETERGKTANGIAFVTKGTGPGPALTMEFDADTVRRIRTTIAITRVADGTPVPYVVEWYWASPSHVEEAGGKWPFSTDRGAAFYQPDRHDAEVRQVDIHEHYLWKGPIAKAFIGVKFTGNEAGPFRVETKKIEFLE
jgi:hypothetical protein